MTGDQRPDSELIASLPRHPELMGVLYERHAPAVFRYLARRAGPTAAEDLLSEVFIGEILVVDPQDGRLLADIDGDPTTGKSCGNGCMEYGAAYAYVSEGPASSAPAVP